MNWLPTRIKQKLPPLLITSLVSTIARFAGVGLNFVVAIVLTRTLSVAEAGMVFMLMTLTTGVALFSRLGVEQWLVRDVARLPEQDTTLQGAHLHFAYRLTLISSAIFLALWCLLAPTGATRLFDSSIHLDALLGAGIGMVCFNIVMLNSAFLKAVRHTSQSILVQNSLPAITYLLLLLGFWLSFRTNQQYLWLYTASLVLAGALSLWWLRPWWKDLITQSSSTLSTRHVLHESLPLAPISFFSFLMLWADTLLTGYLLNNADVALFTVAARLSFVSLFFLGALDATIYPRLLKIHQHHPAQLRRFFWQATLLVAGILGIVTLVLLFAGEYILQVFKPEYTKAALTLALLLLAQFARAMSLTFSFMFIIENKVRYLNSMLMLALIINVIANFWLIPHYGIAGAAGATLTANVLLTGGVIVLFFYHRLLKDQHA